MQDLERIESGKAAAASGTVALLASLPFIITDGMPAPIALVSMATCLASGVLFGVVYRYALRQDTTNFQLKVRCTSRRAVTGCLCTSIVKQLPVSTSLHKFYSTKLQASNLASSLCYTHRQPDRSENGASWLPMTGCRPSDRAAGSKTSEGCF